jgi:acyl-CoA synthetase (AMP-forming)/AMP-acid ligase II
MGLLGSVLRPMWSGYPSVLLDPAAFLARPEDWIQAVSRYRATHVSAPVIGYTRATAARSRCGEVDLSCLQVARVAGGIVRDAPLRRFAEKFADGGFRYAAFCPSYGLTETTLAVSTCRPSQAPRIVHVDGLALRQNVVRPAPDAGVGTVSLMSAGAPLPGTAVTVLDDDGNVLPDGNVGELWVAGPQVALANWRLEGRAGCRTGDLGFVDAGEVIPLGRSVDKFQVRGINYFSTEVEAAVADFDPRLSDGGCAVLVAPPTDDAQADGSDVALLYCLEVGDADIERTQVQRLLRRRFGLSLHTLRRVDPSRWPRAENGKLLRRACSRFLEETASDLS